MFEVVSNFESKSRALNLVLYTNWPLMF